MTDTSALRAAVEVMCELGWDRIAVDPETGPDVAQVLGHSLGTPEQQRVLRAGLTGSALGDLGVMGASSHRWAAWLPQVIDPKVVLWCAIRVGLDARRAHRVGSGVPDDLLVALVESRGEAFVRSYVSHCSPLANRAWEHAASWDAVVALALVARNDLPVPASLGYLKDWAIQADAVFGGTFARTELNPHRPVAATQTIQRRFVEHARLGAELGLAGTGPFRDVLVAGAERGWITRTEARDVALTALDVTQRPGDRKAWVEVLTGPLELTDDEIVARVHSLVPVLAHAEGPVVEAFAPALIAGVDEVDLLEVALLALATPTRKARKVVLEALASARVPDVGTVEVLGPVVAESAGDRTLGAVARRVLARWEYVEDEVTDQQGEVVGLWHPTPPVWQVPRFELGEASVESVVATAAELTARPESSLHDLVVERFVVGVHALARQDVAAARSAVKGVKDHRPGLGAAHRWLKPVAGTDRLEGPCAARATAVFARITEVPVVLSMASWVDLRVDPGDLVERLGEYAEAGVAAAEADLFLALTRLDPALVRPSHRAALASLAVPVLAADGSVVGPHAGELALACLDDPFVEPAAERQRWEPIPTPTAFEAFPPRLAQAWIDAGIGVFPHWRQTSIDVPSAWESAEQGVLMRQRARAAAPFGPELAGSFLVGLRNRHHRAVEEQELAVQEAWERGLLRPGVANIAGGKVEALAALAGTCADLAERGLLSLVWPVLVDLVAHSVQAPRMLAGTAEVVEAVRRFLPEVGAAVTSGVAEPEVLALPGVRALAGRSGSSRAVQVAKEVVALLPEAPAPTVEAVEETVGTEPTDPFVLDTEAWSRASSLPAVEDGTTLRARWVESRGKSRYLGVEITLPGADETWLGVATWFYSLTNEGSFPVGPVDDANPMAARTAWLRFVDGALQVGEHRERPASSSGGGSGDGTGGVAGAGVPPLSTAAAAVTLAALCHDQKEDYSVRSLLEEHVLSPGTIRLAMARMLPDGDLAPGRMVRLMEEHEAMVPLLWPVLTESVRHGATLPKPPAWLNRVLDVALLRAPALRAAADAGFIPADAAAWSGLSDLAARKGTSAVLTKARTLADLLLGPR